MSSHALTAPSELSPPDDARLSNISRRNYAKLMPLLVIVYIISFIDRTNIGMAKASLEVDIGISAAAYGLGAGLFFLTYATFEIPSNLIMHKVGARFWITRIMISWGIVSMLMAVTWNATSFYVLRLLLGVCEAGLYPGIILFITYWFPKRFRARANGMFLLGVSLANIIGAPLGGALLTLDGAGGFKGWQWMFVLEGAPAVLLAFLVWFWLPDRPAQAKWLTDEEKTLLTDQLAREDTGATSKRGGLAALLPVVKDTQIWLIIAVYFTHQIAVYSLSYFLPSIISSYAAFTTFQTGLLTAIPWIAAAIGGLLIPKYATSLGRSKGLISGGLALVCGGLTMAALASSGLVMAMIGFVLAAFAFFIIQSVLFTFPPQRLSGASMAGGIALVNCFGLAGGFLGPTIMGQLETATGNPSAGLWFVVALAAVGSALAWLLKGARRREDAVR
ncbi:MAG: MFS transporter [Propionibacteriaceae bacterium]|jgi:MFS family permease|nr:MFS transporter [Propionibacteriaceae bacterium]